jgi:para-aminobenzoate synthetase component I
LQRQKATFPLSKGEYTTFKKQMLNWANRFSILLFLDSNSYQDAYGKYECLLAIGKDNSTHISNLQQLQAHHDAQKDWLFGHICYDYKNTLQPGLSSAHPGHHHFPELFFFCPDVVIYITRGGQQLTIETTANDADAIYNAIKQTQAGDAGSLPSLQFQKRVDKQTYLDTISKLRNHIADGDCYEINFCTEGYCENAHIEPLSAYHTLNALSPAPFAAYYRNNDNYMMCASPERYIRKQGSQIISQPIKGTARRDADPVKDEIIKTALQQSIKDRAENVMIADLVRNDIARTAITGSVKTEELFGIYSFPQVHQMISTITGTIKPELPFTDVLRYSFPMGSMTGAPKIKVMQLIEQYEQSCRELFSGTVGYISPEGNFDFNVIIRSIFYNAATRYLSYQTGGAITYDSTPEQEWEEMRLKAWALERVFAAG